MTGLQRTSAQTEIDFDLQGKLGAFSISDLFQMLSFTQKTGTVTLMPMYRNPQCRRLLVCLRMWHHRVEY